MIYDLAHTLFDQALLAEGGMTTDPVATSSGSPPYWCSFA
jgi:hypothetical protein